jgi:outer membrane protein assembly factor BamD
MEDPILRLSSAEAFTKGQELMADEKYELAREHFAHAFQTAPNSEIGRDALLLQADAYYLAGGEQNLIRAEAKYRDFNNRYPTSDRGAYVQYQIARCLDGRKRKPDRDQTETRKGIEAYQELLALYPTSEYAAEAEAGIAELRLSLAAHDFLVARYQFRRGLHGAAVNRLEGLLEEYPDYPDLDRALCMLARSYRQLELPGKSGDAVARLREDFPQSDECAKLRPMVATEEGGEPDGGESAEGTQEEEG